jgi:hypothetical protein
MAVSSAGYPLSALGISPVGWTWMAPGKWAHSIPVKDYLRDDLEFIIRLPLPGKTNHEKNLDEKVAAEVAAMNLVRENADIPVPIVYAWGSASENPLGLGPFMLIEFKEGILLDDLITKKDSRLMREDIPRDFIEGIYRQMAQIQLELYTIDLDVIGSLPLASRARVEVSTGGPQLTFKVNGMRQIGGVYARGKILIPLSPIDSTLRRG